MPAAQAAKEEIPVFLLAAGVCPELIENPHLGHRLPTAVLYPGIGSVNSNTASGLRVCLYDSGRGSRSTGKERDQETNNDFFQARYMSAFQMRFTSPDPLGNFVANAADPQSWNMYAYARNNPLALVDPTGLDYCDLGGGDWSYNPSVGGLTQDECAYENGTWVAEPLSTTVTAGQNEGDITFDLQDWLDQWSAENGPLDPAFTFYATGTGAASSTGNFSAPSVPGASQACPAGGSIYSGSLTFPLTGADAAVGSIFGPMGMLPGALIGSMFGVGGTASYVPSTRSIYTGPTLTFGLGILGGGGFSVSRVDVPGTQNANAIANSWSFSATYQPTFATGATATKSPGSGPPVGGFSIGTRVPFAASASYNICLRNCGCH